MTFASSLPCFAEEASEVSFSPSLDKLFLLTTPYPDTILDDAHETNTVKSRRREQRHNLLSLPAEIRLEIYSYLLLITSSPRARNASSPICAPILRVNRQIHAEASPVLYSKNKWLAHQTLLTSFPRLRSSFPVVTDASLYPRMRRFHVRVRLDCDPPYDRDTVTKAFSGVDELTIETFQAMYLGTGYAALKRFEGIRGVKRVKIWGNTTCFEPYISWLESVMMSEAGSEPAPYVETDRVLLMFL